jgi:GTP:adenosylcobinamide-phosphate guanylyltransferase
VDGLAPLQRFNALILAGSRGKGDPIARLAGVTHKALTPIHGVPMLLRLYRTLRAMDGIGRIFVCIDDPAMLDATSELAQARDRNELVIVRPAASPAASLVKALDEIGVTQPLLVTTADHPLLSVEMITHLFHETPAGADLAVGLARAETVLAAYPGSLRTFYRFRGRRYAGCNLFLVRSLRARNVALFWQKLERFRKKPWRLVLAIGPTPLFRMLLGKLDLDEAFRHVSNLTEASIRPVLLPFAEAAIDVDKPEDFILVENILKTRESV